jgi:hypothetical protein
MGVIEFGREGVCVCWCPSMCVGVCVRVWLCMFCGVYVCVGVCVWVWMYVLVVCV